MRSSEAVIEKETPLFRIATWEIWLGVLAVAITLLHLVLEKFGYGLELHGALALLPLLLMWSGILLVVAGGLWRRFPTYPLLCHVPLLLWFLVFFFAFL